jgi:hypothetical protein
MKILSLLAIVFSFLNSPAKADETSWYDQWLNRVTAIQAAQPHWMTPLVTVTPRLEQEVRSDFVAQASPKGHELSSFGNGKGLELIPIDRVEVILNVPPYLEHNNAKIKDGFGDFSTLFKYRILSSNEENDNYILTAFLGISFPTGTATNGSTTSVFTPTIAAGKGIGAFDIQSTLGFSLPEDVTTVGHKLTWNTALQFHYERYFWPQLEDNFLHAFGGSVGGTTQNYLTPGILFGRFIIHERTTMSTGFGCQLATSDYRPYQHAWVFSARLPF